MYLWINKGEIIRVNLKLYYLHFSNIRIKSIKVNQVDQKLRNFMCCLSFHFIHGLFLFRFILLQCVFFQWLMYSSALSLSLPARFPSLIHFFLHHLPPPPALKDDRFQMVLFTPRLVRITLTNVSVSDEGGYFCQLYTDATHHQVATLSVLVPPEMPTVEVKQEAVEGGEVELTCVSPRSKPATSLRWVRNSREIPGTSTGFIDRLMNG